MREDPQEEVLAKVCATTLVVYAAERLKKDQGCGAKVCDICCLETHRQDCMALPCGHCFHEHCLWQWIYVRQVCPTCLRKLN
jgi:E3 ubiquitin-protein ligase synoviolin